MSTISFLPFYNLPLFYATAIPMNTAQTGNPSTPSQKHHRPTYGGIPILFMQCLPASRGKRGRKKSLLGSGGIQTF